MPHFGAKSLERLATCHPDLQRLFQEVVKRVDCAILCGHRDEEAQTKAFREGHSQTPWPRSKHNTIPSLAVDVAPWHPDPPHIRWTDRSGWYWFVGYVEGVADGLGIEVRTGADWDGDGDFTDHALIDLPHWELADG